MRITSTARALRAGGGPLPPLLPRGKGESPAPALRRPRTGRGSPVQSAQADFVPFQRRIHSLLAPAGNPHSLGRSFAGVDAARAA